MTIRVVHAFQASIISALVALAVSYPILVVAEAVDSPVFGALTACAAALVVAWPAWYLAFPGVNTSPRRSIWIGPLIVFLSMWAIFVVFALTIDATYLDSGSAFDILAKAVFMGLFFSVFGSLYTGILLFPLSILIAFLLRKRQTGMSAA